MPSSSAPPRRKYGNAKHAHRLDDLYARDMTILLRPLSTDFREACSHCRYWGCFHGEKCTRYHIRRLPEHLRSHKEGFLLALLKGNARSNYSLVAELCPTHSKLRPDLMWDILNIFRESEDVLAATIAQLANATNGSFVDEHNLNMIAPLKVLAEASLMWTGECKLSRAREWKKKYPGARPRGQWRAQRNHCSACIIESTLKSTELLSIVLLCLWIQRDGPGRATAPSRSVHYAIAWVHRCLDLASSAARAHAITEATDLRSWINGQLAELWSSLPNDTMPWSSERNEYAKLVCLLQEQEAAKLRGTRLVTDPVEIVFANSNITARSSVSGESEATDRAAQHHTDHEESTPVRDRILPNQHYVLESQSTPFDDFWSSVTRKVRNEDPSRRVSGTTSFLDDDALNGELTRRKRGDMLHSSQRVGTPPSMGMMTGNVSPSLAANPPEDCTSTQPSEQSLTSFHRWINGVNSQTSYPGNGDCIRDDTSTESSATSTMVDPSHLHLASDLDYSGISEVGRRIESVIGHITDDT